MPRTQRSAEEALHRVLDTKQRPAYFLCAAQELSESQILDAVCRLLAGFSA
jgi:hypothetical protein